MTFRVNPDLHLVTRAPTKYSFQTDGKVKPLNGLDAHGSVRQVACHAVVMHEGAEPH